MNIFIQKFGNLAAWSSAIVLMFGIALLNLMNYLRPEWFCQPINPGGKEFVCGADHTVSGVFILNRVVLGVSLGFYSLAIVALLKGTLKRGGITILGMLSVLFVTGLVLTYVLGQSDSP